MKCTYPNAHAQTRHTSAPQRNASSKTADLNCLLTNHHQSITMSDIGPELPPHLLAKKKRKQEEAAETARATTSGAKQPDSPNGDKRRRVIGPAMPPAPLDERPSEPAEKAEEESSDDDDGFGPALPANGAQVGLHIVVLAFSKLILDRLVARTLTTTRVNTRTRHLTQLPRRRNSRETTG